VRPTCRHGHARGRALFANAESAAISREMAEKRFQLAWLWDRQ